MSVLLFGPLRERAGAAGITVRAATVRDAWGEVVAQHPAVAPMLEGLRAACNEEYCDWDRVLGDGDVVAFIPPVAGG